MTRADLIILGGGIAGHACARRSAALGARVVLIDGGDWRESQFARSILPQALLARLVAEGGDGAALLRRFAKQRDLFVAQQLEGLARSLRDLGVRRVAARGRIDRLRPNAEVDTELGAFSAPRLVLAVGARVGRPVWAGPGSPVVAADDLYGSGMVLPERAVVVGDGYIAVAQALLLDALGVEVTLICAGEEPLAGFDGEMRRFLAAALVRRGIRLRPSTVVEAVSPGDRRHAVETTAGVQAAELIVVAGASPPVPNTHGLALDRFGVNCTVGGAVFVNSRYAANVEGLFAIGDCADHGGHGLDPATYDLGGVAETEGRRLAEALFGMVPPPLDYDLVPLAVAGPLPLGSVGLGAERAAGLGIEVRAVTHADRDDRLARLVLDAASRRIVGCHLVGGDADRAIGRIAGALSAGSELAHFLPRLAARDEKAAAWVQELVAQVDALG